jgi:hypothetical protein
MLLRRHAPLKKINRKKPKSHSDRKFEGHDDTSAGGRAYWVCADIHIRRAMVFAAR